MPVTGAAEIKPHAPCFYLTFACVCPEPVLANGRPFSRFKEANNCKIQSSKRKEDRNHAFLPLLFLFSSSSSFAPSEDVTERHLVHGLAEALELLEPDPFKPRQILVDLTLQIRKRSKTVRFRARCLFMRLSRACLGQD
eukprot:COSAG06_NODE_3673_length_5030_cov_6.804097_2_plen_139_part_00